MKKNFTGLFISKEAMLLIGPKGKKLYLIILILLITYLMIGFALGSRKYLDSKMKNPFINYQGFDLNYSVKDKLDSIINPFKDSLNERFLIKKISEHEAVGFDFVTKKKNKIWMKGLSIDSNDSILNFILQKSNSSVFKPAEFDNTYGIIVRKASLNRLGYNLNSDSINFLNVSCELFNDERKNDFSKCLGGKENYEISVPVMLVVDDLPLERDFICSKKTLYIIGNYSKAINLYEDIGKAHLFLPMSEKKPAGIPLKEVDKKLFFEGSYLNGTFFEVNDTIVFLEYLKNKYEYECNFSITFSKDQIEKILEGFDERKKSTFFLSFQFNELDSLRSLKEYMELIQQKFGLEEKQLFNIDVSSLESKESFNFISKLTFVLSISIIVFGAVSLITFLINNIQNYFEKIKKNLGTLKAFGLSNKVVIKNYLFIYTGIILFISVFSFLSAALLGELGFSLMLIKAMRINPEINQDYFDLFNPVGIATLCFFIILSSIVTYFNLIKILSRTPGDLIFDR